jgi:hypothetical protein
MAAQAARQWGTQPEIRRLKWSYPGRFVRPTPQVAQAAPKGDAMSEDEKIRALPRDIPTYHERQAAHLRALAEQATTERLKRRLLREAELHEYITRE